MFSESYLETPTKTQHPGNDELVNEWHQLPNSGNDRQAGEAELYFSTRTNKQSQWDIVKMQIPNCNQIRKLNISTHLLMEPRTFPTKDLSLSPQMSYTGNKDKEK